MRQCTESPSWNVIKTCPFTPKAVNCQLTVLRDSVTNSLDLLLALLDLTYTHQEVHAERTGSGMFSFRNNQETMDVNM